MSQPLLDARDWSRRQFVRGLGFGLGGLTLPAVLAANDSMPRLGKAKRCLMIFLFGGPSQIDTWDMKPDAPAEYRGEFQPIATSVPGIQCCEHLPKSAKLAHRLAIVRSLTMTGHSIGDHHADTYYILTGRKPDPSFFVEGINRKPRADDWPFIGSTAAARLPPRPDLPGVVQAPARSGEVTNYINPGQFSGTLGPAHEPVVVRGQIDKPDELTVPDFLVPDDIPPERLQGRADLLGQIDAWRRSVDAGARVGAYNVHHDKARRLLTSQKARDAFDLAREPAATRDRYGHEINAQSVLLARRLLEADVPFVAIHWIGRRVGAGLSWDTHSDNFGQLKNVLLPAFDQCFSALLEDLADRGLLDETLVYVTAEMGRTPKVGDVRTKTGAPGRDHWIHCQTALLAGGGISGGQVYGRSDRYAAYPAENPVTPERLTATVYGGLGILDQMDHVDPQGRRRMLLEEGEPLPLF